MSQGGSKKVSNSLLAMSSAAILAVYTAGYSRTRSAADRFAVQAEERRPAVPAARSAAPVPEATAAPTPAPSDRRPEAGVRPAAAEPVKPSQARAEVASAATTATAAQPPVETHAPVPALPAEPAPVIAEAKTEAPAPVPVVTAVPAAPVAPVAPVVPAAPAAPAHPVWKDGTYTGWGYSRHGNIEAAVVIEGGRILSATISQCRTRYSCDVIDKLPPEVHQRQSPDVDTVSGATQSADAFYYAVVEALAKAK